MRGSAVRSAALVAVVAALGWVGGEADAQEFRGSASTTVRYIELRPLAVDTVDRSRVTETTDGNLEFEGRPVTCDAGGVCTFRHSPSTESAVTAYTDLRLTTWAFGVEGLSAEAHLRAREELGEDFVWPRGEDPLDLVTGYLQYNRDELRLRLGRQRSRSGLGFDSYDGLSVLYEPERWIRAEVFGGRSLARGLHEPRHEALRGVEDFLLDRNAWLLGGSVDLTPTPGTDLTARYQREIWSNRAALVSERASLDLRTDLLRPLTIEGAVDYDFALGRFGKSHLTLSLPLAERRVRLEATARRYLPYFELWTIWGLFDPAAYHEGRLRVAWSPSSDFTAWGEGGYRSYEDTNTSPLLGPLEDDAIRAAVGGRWSASPSVRLEGTYRLERGAGAFLSSGEASVDWQATGRLRLSVQGMAAQQIEEFRLGEGMVAGGGVSGSYEPGGRVGFSGGVNLYRRFFDNRPGAVDWNQLRAWSSLRVTLGGDPGRRREGGRR